MPTAVTDYICQVTVQILFLILINFAKCSILALIEFTFHVEIFINYIENEVPQPHEEEALGLVILNEEPINSLT